MAGKNYWETPWELVRACEARWGKFGLDVCATLFNSKGAVFITEEMDGLATPWDINRHLPCWMNPPYSDAAGKPCVRQWVEKAAAEAEKGAMVVALLNNDPSTEWFRLAHDTCAEMWFLLGSRIRFELDGKIAGSPTQTHVIAVFRKLREGERRKGGFWDWRSDAQKGAVA